MEVDMAFTYPSQFQEEAFRRMLDGERVNELAREVGVSIATLHRWKTQALIQQGRVASTD
jgi:transposase-like protein